MAEVTAAMVKELRERTQAGMMDCKKALVESNGNMDAAVEYLREKGLAGANKKSGRIAAEGFGHGRGIATRHRPKVCTRVQKRMDGGDPLIGYRGRVKGLVRLVRYERVVQIGEYALNHGVLGSLVSR